LQRAGASGRSTADIDALAEAMAPVGWTTAGIVSPKHCWRELMAAFADRAWCVRVQSDYGVGVTGLVLHSHCSMYMS